MTLSMIFFACGGGDDEITRSNQTITFNELLPANLSEGSITLTAFASSALPLTYTVSDPAVASVSGSTLILHRAGEIAVTASQDGNDRWNAAVNTVRRLTVAEDNNPDKKNQTVTEFDLPDAWTSDQGEMPLAATASSGLTVKFYSTSQYVEIKGNNLKLLDDKGHYNNVEISVVAHQSGNDEYNASEKTAKKIKISHTE